MDSATRVQILNMAVCISYYTNTHEKDTNPTFSPSVAMGE